VLVSTVYVTRESLLTMLNVGAGLLAVVGVAVAATLPTSPTNATLTLNSTLAEPKYPFRDLPADVLRDFPGLCFGSTALRLFHVGQAWSLAPFCGVAICIESEDAQHLVERVQDCGPLPKKNPKCSNVNNATAMEVPFPGCCPQYECEEGAVLEYPTPEELVQMAREAAEAVIRGQYDEEDEAVNTENVARTAREISQEQAGPEEVSSA